MKISLREDHTKRMLWKRTISAQLHALGCILCLIGAYFLLPRAKAVGPNHFLACLIFLITGFTVFAASTVYHFIDDGFHTSPRLEKFLNNLDHFSIYLFIAGTYTPFFLNTLSSPWKEIHLYAIWIIAGLGILYTWLKPRLPQFLQRRFVYTLIFILMGWTMVFKIVEIFSRLSETQIFFLILGGAFYTLGAVVYATKRPKLIPDFFGFHELWHIAVLGGAISHYFMVSSFYSQ